MSVRLNTLEGCYAFVKSQNSESIARQILHDQQICREGRLPSLVVHCLPARTDGIARAISESPDIPLAVARMRLSSILSTIKNHLAAFPRSPPTDTIPDHLIPTDSEYHAALKVLRYLQLPQGSLHLDTSTPLSEVAETIQSQLGHGPRFQEFVEDKQKRRRPCYICRFVMASPHKFYPSLCNPCGEFNIASSSLSLPTNLNLVGKTALVTGGRINLGYHTTLRLLRCGARVIVSTRYPLDGQSRYVDEPDFQQWQDRLKIVGADFRSAKDVFCLVNAVLKCLKEWDPDRVEKLDILVNNAAQTLTDSVQQEEANIRRETEFGCDTSPNSLLEGNYAPRVRGGVVGYQIESTSSGKSFQGPVKSAAAAHEALITSEDAKSLSWIQRMSDIPYEDVISAHSVNTFVPFILLRELLPYIGSRAAPPSSDDQPHSGDSPSQKPKPNGYVINVSSREGLFESTPNHGSKNGHHVHTNMSKAALNMLTETEASAAWRNGRVAINTVDPGYMSADPMYMEMVGRGKGDQSCPIGWEDGAGRVLWPIAQGERGEIVRGRFLKHFAVVDVVR